MIIRCQTCNTSGRFPISVSLDKGYVMDDYRVSRDSTNHHVLIMIKLEEEYKCFFYTESKKKGLFRSLCSYSQGHKLPVLKHGHTVTMFLKEIESGAPGWLSR